MTIKKISYVFILVVLVISCDRDEKEISDEGLIVGQWSGFGEKIVNVDGTFNSKDSRPCKGSEKLTFDSDGSMTFREDELVNDTECFIKELAKGTWERLETGKYRWAFIDSAAVIDRIIEPELVSFRQEGEVMAVQFDPIVDNGTDPPFYYEIIFFRED